MEQMNPGKNILICPLDWGLGHATRCIPIIRQLQLNHRVVIASSGSAAKLLQQEFPHLTHHPLPSYRISYPTRRSMSMHMAFQLPSVYATILQEKKVIRKIVKDEKIDLVISDNRFGAFHKTVSSVFITHQVNIKTPFLNKFINRLNHRAIRNFHHCWIPDEEKAPGLAGELSRPAPVSPPSTYIGPLSRFSSQKTEKKYDITVVLSGPEPQRTLLEDILFEELFNFPDLNICFIRGVYDSRESSLVKNIQVYDHLPATDLEKMLHESRHIICRSGYSGIMDLQFINAKVLLVPTPQQTEQEYLAKIHSGTGKFVTQEQHRISIADFMKDAAIHQSTEIPNPTDFNALVVQLTTPSS